MVQFSGQVVCSVLIMENLDFGRGQNFSGYFEV